MFIVPMSSSIMPLNSIIPINTENKSQSEGSAEAAGSFVDIFKQAVQNVEDTRKVSEEDSIKVAMGEIDDLHTVKINADKAALAIETFVTLKNTAIEAYNEVMRMSI